MKKSNARNIYLFIEAASALLFSMAFVAMSLYEVRVANLSPLQLVLVGTTLEISVMLFEVPTGVVADVYSRRLSVIIGYCIVGVGFLVEGFFPKFMPILLAQVLRGLGHTFTSGARQAWISDEIGEEQANRVFLRANRYALGGALSGMLFSIIIGNKHVNLPILTSGTLLIILGIFLAGFMPELGFSPKPRQDRSTFHHMLDTLKMGLATIRSQPRLVSILGVGLFYGLYSEGFDRLWVKHLLDRFDLPILFGQNEVAFLGLLRAAATLLSIIATGLVERRVDSSQPRNIGRAMLTFTFALSVGLIIFSFSPFLVLTIGTYWLIAIIRNLIDPLYTAWVNQRLDPTVRATVLSMSTQVDAIGQIAGGPAIGLFANLVSVPAAITVSGLLVTPSAIFIKKANTNA